MKHEEYNEQVAFIRWCKLATRQYPELNMIYCNHNTQILNKMQSMRWKLLGGRSGVPDCFLPVSRNGFNGLYIEFKSPKLKPKTMRSKGGMSEEQTEFALQLRQEGYCVEVCYSWLEAKNVIENYFKNENK